MSIFEFSLKYIKYFDHKKDLFLKITNKFGLELYVTHIKDTSELLFVFEESKSKTLRSNNVKYTPEFLFPSTYFHRGAYTVLHESKFLILELITKWQVTIQNTVIIGFSHGGFLAQCLAYELLCCTSLRPTLYIYGSAIILSEDIQKCFLNNNIFIFQIIINKDVFHKFFSYYYDEIVSMKLILKSNKPIYCIKTNHNLSYYKYLLNDYFSSIR